MPLLNSAFPVHFVRFVLTFYTKELLSERSFCTGSNISLLNYKNPVFPLVKLLKLILFSQDCSSLEIFGLERTVKLKDLAQSSKNMKQRSSNSMPV